MAQGEAVVDVVHLEGHQQEVWLHPTVQELISAEAKTLKQQLQKKRPSYLPPPGDPAIVLEEKWEQNLKKLRRDEQRFIRQSVADAIDSLKQGPKLALEIAEPDHFVARTKAGKYETYKAVFKEDTVAYRCVSVYAGKIYTEDVFEDKAKDNSTYHSKAVELSATAVWEAGRARGARKGPVLVVDASDMGNESREINHFQDFMDPGSSQRANVELVSVVDYREGGSRQGFCCPYVVVMTRCKVKKGDEALLDYGPNYFPNILTSLWTKIRRLEEGRDAQERKAALQRKALKRQVKRLERDNRALQKQLDSRADATKKEEVDEKTDLAGLQLGAPAALKHAATPCVGETESAAGAKQQGPPAKKQRTDQGHRQGLDAATLGQAQPAHRPPAAPRQQQAPMPGSGPGSVRQSPSPGMAAAPQPVQAPAFGAGAGARATTAAALHGQPRGRGLPSSGSSSSDASTDVRPAGAPATVVAAAKATPGMPEQVMMQQQQAPGAAASGAALGMQANLHITLGLQIGAMQQQPGGAVVHAAGMASMPAAPVPAPLPAPTPAAGAFGAGGMRSGVATGRPAAACGPPVANQKKVHDADVIVIDDD